MLTIRQEETLAGMPVEYTMPNDGNAWWEKWAIFDSNILSTVLYITVSGVLTVKLLTSLWNILLENW